MAAAIQTTPAYSAFEKQLKTLCLKEFPCGVGTWRENSTDNLGKVKNTAKVEHRFSVTLKDFGAKNEKTETLQEYVGSTKSPWHLDYSWSQEAKQLREISVKSPWLIDDNFVLNHFKTLRIVSKDVTYIDSNLLKFKNLEELTLSCNRISQIDSRNLPSNLKVLEVCANEVSDLSSLCIKPPKLIHLGLGYNRLSLIGDYLTGQYWPQLLSLDLSNNDLSDLLDVVRKLSSLPKLRNLVLQGNPCSLIPGYRGYTVDSLKKLNILDDIMISADERHYYKGLARRREHILDEAKVKLGVTYIKGIPIPEEIKNPDDQPEFPVIERKYFVQFMFLEDSTLKFEGQDNMGDMADMSGFPTERTDLSDIGEQQMNAEGQYVEKNVLFTQEPDVTHTIDNTVDVTVQEPENKEEEKKEDNSEPEITIIPIAAVDSEKHTWAEELECNWSNMVVRDDLLSLRDFFRQGMQIAVIEELTLSYPVIPEEGEEGAVPNPKRKGSSRISERSKMSRSQSRMSQSQSRMSQSSKQSSAKQSSRKSVEAHLIEPEVPVANKSSAVTGKSSAKGSRKGSAKSTGKDKKKEKDDKSKSGGKEKGGDKKKKKGEPEQELKRNPPTYTTLATWHVPLAEFLEGEYEYQSVFSQGGVEVASTVRSLDSARKGLKSRGSGRASSRVSRKDESIIGELRNITSRMGMKSSLGAGSRRASRSSRSGLLDDKKGDPKDKKKPTSASKKKDDKDKSKDRKASASKTGKDAKGDKGKGGKGAAAPTAADEEEDPGPPPPLEIHISVQLHHWKTAMDLLRDEEEKNKQEETCVVETTA